MQDRNRCVFYKVVLFKCWMKLFKIAGKNPTVQERSLMHRNQPKLRTSLSGAHIHLIENFHLNIDPILFYLSAIHCSIHASTGKFHFEENFFFYNTQKHCSIYWGPSLRALCHSKEIEGKYVFLGSWPLRILFTPTIAVQMASQGICTSFTE